MRTLGGRRDGSVHQTVTGCVDFVGVPTQILGVFNYLSVLFGVFIRGELSGLDQFLDRTSAVYSIFLYTMASSIDNVIHQWHFRSRVSMAPT